MVASVPYVTLAPKGDFKELLLTDRDLLEVSFMMERNA